MRNQGVVFDDTFKAKNYILSVAPWANGMINWMVKNSISKGEGNCFKNL